MPRLPAKLKTLLMLAKSLQKQKSNFSRSALFHKKTRVSLNYFVSDCRLNGVFSRDNLPRIKDGPYVINLDDKKIKRTHWVSLFTNRNITIYFDSFGIKFIPQEELSKIKDKFIMRNMFRVQDDGSFMSRILVFLS